MDYLSHTFLESPPWLGVFSFLLFAVVLFGRRRLEGRSRDWALPGTLVLIVLLFVVQHLVVTPREEVRAALDELVAAIEREDRAAIAAVVSPAYQSEDMGHADLLAHIETALARMRIYDTRLSSVDIRIEGQRAGVTFLARATVAIESAVGDEHWGRWRVDFVREGGAWRIISIRPVVLDGVEVRNLRGLAQRERPIHRFDDQAGMTGLLGVLARSLSQLSEPLSCRPFEEGAVPCCTIRSDPAMLDGVLAPAVAFAAG